jgi:membrane protein implicated in regulation of membrane protease activity
MIDAAMVFFIIFLIGLVFIILTAVMGGLGHVGGADTDASTTGFDTGDSGGDAGGHADVDSDAGGHDVGDHDVGGHDGGFHMPRVSPLMIALAMTTFGGFGWSFVVMTPQLPLVGAIIAALVLSSIITAAVFLGFIKAMSRVQASSVFRLSESVNTIGTVSTPMSPGKIGVVEHELRGQVVSSSAKSDDELKVGDQVLIKQVMGDMIIVKKLTEKPESASAEHALLRYGEKGSGSQGNMER